MIAIVDYGLGNVQASANIDKRLNIEAALASTVEVLDGAERIILPGAGSFDWPCSYSTGPAYATRSTAW